MRHETLRVTWLVQNILKSVQSQTAFFLRDGRCLGEDVVERKWLPSERYCAQRQPRLMAHRS